jgi:mannosyltransferase OCH1-like enzyme
MRRGTIIFLVINLIIIGFLIHAFGTLVSLLFENGGDDRIHRSDIPAPGSNLIDNRTQLIPKILHQTYINATIPDRWRAGQQSCLDLHPDYEYKLWTDEKSRQFIAKEYPWFLATFDSYPFPIQRADTIRYFVLAHYGGIYIDLDDGCNRKLDPLLSYPAWLRVTTPSGISNDAMGSIPQHPFFLSVIEQLAGYNRNWIMPYITVMYSTGPLFLSVIWKEYLRTMRPSIEHVRILGQDEYKGYPWSFFNVVKGNSWHGKDAQTIFWAGRHWFFLTVCGFAIAGTFGLTFWWIWKKWCMCNQGKKTSPGRGSILSLFRRASSKESYELVDHMA